jgi:hypothetical protein
MEDLAVSSRDFWYRRQHKFPHQILVPHMSDEDVDPKLVPQIIGWEHKFIRVPFKGTAHWGFQTSQGLELFKNIAFGPKVLL